MIKTVKLSALLKSDLIWTGFDAPDKWNAIEQMVDRLVRNGQIREGHRGECLNALIAREKLGSTGTGHGVALPHAAVDGPDDVTVLMCLSPQGIPFEASDGQPAKILVLLLLPKKNRQQHIHTLAGIARVLNEEETRQNLLHAVDGAEVLRILQAEENRRKS